jgi:ubiquinone/menaquinone biosynthesis C-methylase UbiE
VTRYLDRVLAGDVATPQEWNEHLVAFHRAYRGSTEAFASRMHTRAGQTSYEVLASRIKELEPNAHAILDVGCGEGALLVDIERCFGGNVTLTGIDLSDTEIAQARARVPKATFLLGDALELDMDLKSQDVVTSHLAFMAMPQTGRLFARAYRALRAAGLLAFVAEDPLAGRSMFNLLATAVAVVRERFVNFTPSVPAREPIEREDDLRALLERAGFTNVAIEAFEVSGKLSAEQLWNFVEQSYPLGLLDASVRVDLRDALRARTEAIASNAAESVLALRLVTARA